MKQDIFEAALSTLNKEQRHAVEQIYGPVMVIAGPGTGKTQILALRIGNILVKTDTDPRNILCLTYTEAGTVAMRKRLIEFIGTSAYAVNIHTFHGFCNKIINENPQLFHEHRELQVIDELERLDVFIEIIDSWTSDHPLKRLKGDLYAEMDRMNNLFNAMKKEGWSSSYVIQRADQYLNELPMKEGYFYKRNNKTKGIVAGDPKMHAIEAEIKRIEKFKAAAGAFDDYNKKLLEKGRFDFADMILWVLNTLKKNESLLFDLQEQYQYILVDEYQDTNGSQNELLYFLCSDPTQQPNVFVVGDDDQSIYRFQGANLNNILDFGSRWGTNLSTIILSHNYRSTQPILDAAHNLINHNLERLSKADVGIDKKLIASGPNSQLSTGVLIGEFETETEELLGIRHYTRQLIDQGVNPNEIAILFRTRKNISPLIKYFQFEKIPYSIKKINNVLLDPFIQNLILTLRYLSEEIQNPFSSSDKLFFLLHHPWFEIPVIDLANISAYHREDNNRDWRNWVTDEKELHQIRLLKREKIRHSATLIESWIKIGMNDTLQKLFESILYSKPIFKYLQGSGDLYNMLKMSNSFFNFIKDQSDKNEQITLQTFLTTLDHMISYKISIPYTNIDKTGKGIQLLTAHGSKGLEFEYVVIMGGNEKKWEKDVGARNKNFKYPDTLISSNEENKIEDDRRLFYVALTRAKKEALITYSNTLLNGKAEAVSTYVIETIDSNATTPWINHSTQPEKELFLLSQYMPSPIIQTGYPPQIDEILSKLTLNISGINKYLTCPVRYYYENILRAPLSKTAPIGYGNAVHFSLEQLFKSAENNFPGIEQFLTYFEYFMKKESSAFSMKQFEGYLENGRKKLPLYYHHHIEEWKKIKKVRLEYHIRDVEINGVPVSGIFDRVDFIDNKMHVIDYKTGSSRTGIEKLRAPKADIQNPKHILNQILNPEVRNKERIRIQGGDYWRQLVFYKLLAKVDLSITEPFESAHVSFIEADDNIALYKKEVIISTEAEEFVKKQILDVYNKIKNKEFSPGCGRENCKWCALVSEETIE